MASDDRNDNFSSQSLTEETTLTKSHQSTSSTGTLTLPTLPFDVIPEILCRLPVKLLIQLRCLCKSFNSLISDPKFAKKHLHFSTKRHHLMINSRNNLGEFVPFDSLITSVFETTSTVTQTQLSYPISFEKRKPLIFSSCDGIICITCIDLSALLWNPSIRKFKLLPPLDNPRKRGTVSFYSFGYDHFIHNYKVIGISFCDKTNEVSVLTLGTNHWRRIQDFPYSGYIHGSGVFVSGTVNWLAFDASNSVVLVSLDLENESYQKLSKPDFGMNTQTLEILRDCLCIFAKNDIFLDVWIMKEYGNKDSWTKLYSVPCCLCFYAKALYVSEDDQMLMNFLCDGE